MTKTPKKLDYFWTTNDPRKYYLLGLYFAQGHLAEPSAVTLYVGASEEEHMKNIAAILGARYHKTWHKVVCYEMYYGGVEFTKFLNSYGMYAPSVRESIFMCNIPPEFQRDYLRGYSDGHGSISVKDGGIRVQFSDKMRVLRDLRDYLDRLSISSTLRFIDNSFTKNILALTTAQAEKFRDLIYYHGCFCNEDKKRVYFSSGRPGFIPAPPWYEDDGDLVVSRFNLAR